MQVFSPNSQWSFQYIFGKYHVGTSNWWENTILYVSELIRHDDIIHVVTCRDMLQGIMAHPAYQFKPDASRIKLYFLVWQIL
jgi:hypothetical protein